MVGLSVNTTLHLDHIYLVEGLLHIRVPLYTTKHWGDKPCSTTMVRHADTYNEALGGQTTRPVALIHSWSDTLKHTTKH